MTVRLARPIKLVRGCTRLVILTRRYAIKVPTTRPYGRRGEARLHWWCRGLMANTSERQWSGMDGVAPVLRSWLGGVVQVYPRCAPVGTEWEDATLEDYRAIAAHLPASDKKPTNLGLLEGRVVWIDFDTSWNGCPHEPWHAFTDEPRGGDRD